MARPRKNPNLDPDEEVIEIEDPEPKKAIGSVNPTGINIADLVNSVRGRYGKDQEGLKNDLTTADNIVLSTEDSAYVLSDEVEFWRPLTGIKGIPYGRICQISGKPDSGKSTTAMMFMKAAQKAGNLVILWDAEKKFSARRYRDSMGGDPDTLVVTRSKNIQEGAKHISWIIRDAKEQNPSVRIFLVWDSVGGTLNTAEDNDEKDDFSKQPGVTAKEVNYAVKKFNKLIERYRDPKTGDDTIACCFVNQVYAMIGSMPGDKEKGGQGLEFFSSLILRLKRIKELTRIRGGQKMKYGIVTRAKVKKNHLFDGEECIAELDLIVSADGIKLLKDIKPGSWDDESVDDD